MLTRIQVARRLFVHPNTVPKFVARGLLTRLPAPSGRRRWYYDPVEVAVLRDRIRRHEVD